MGDRDFDSSFRQAIGLPATVRLDGILRAHAPLRNGEHVCHQDDQFRDVYYVLNGVLKAYRISPSGEEQVLRFNYPGELLWTGGKRTISVMSVGASRVCSIPFMSLQHLMFTYPEVQDRCYALLSRLIVEEEKFLCVLSHGDADRRLAFLLLQFCDHFCPERPGQCTCQLPMTRVDIGNYLGLRVETIIRTLRKLERERMIAVSGRDVTIVDAAALRGLVDGTCHRCGETASSRRSDRKAEEEEPELSVATGG